MNRGRWPVVAALLVLAVSACSPSAGGNPSASASAEPSVAASVEPSTSSDPSTDPSPGSTPAPVSRVPDGALLPDLVMEPLADWEIEYANNRRLLHVTTIFSNYGVGAFELRGGRASGGTVMNLEQVIYTGGGSFELVPTRVDALYAGDGHNHWHAQQVVTMELANVLDPAHITNGNKIHFCFFDNTSTNEDLPGYDPDPYYSNTWCGTPDSSSIRMGLSIGYGDRYGYNFVGQYVDITNLPGGTYTLKATVDASNNFFETNDADNCTMARIQIPAAGEGAIVVVEAGQLDCPT
ncbi:MAG TPA: lysyl oxidase family protein [Candidatus Limnocylindria bacterium]